MLCGKMRAPGRQLPVGRFYAARLRDTGTAQTGGNPDLFPPSPSLLVRARPMAVPRCAVEPGTHTSKLRSDLVH